MEPKQSLYWNNSDSYRQILEAHTAKIIVAPFIQRAALETLLGQEPQSDLKIITRWKPNDLVAGVSDIEIYPLLQQHRISLYIHDDIHLKLMILDDCAFHMSSNISKRGLGYADKKNIEVGCFIDLTEDDWIEIYRILHSSIRVSDALYEKAKSYRTANKAERPPLPTLDLVDETDGFSILDLPATDSPATLKEYYFCPKESGGHHSNACIHDLLNFRISPHHCEDKFMAELRHAFCSQPFICSFVQHLKNETTLSFGQVKQWLQQTCADQPTPYRWELTENTQYLYAWLDFFFDEISWDRPNYSMVIKWAGD